MYLLLSRNKVTGYKCLKLDGRKKSWEGYINAASQKFVLVNIVKLSFGFQTFLLPVH